MIVRHGEWLECFYSVNLHVQMYKCSICGHVTSHCTSECTKCGSSMKDE